MYHKRLKIFISIFLIFLAISIVRLFQLQVLQKQEALDNIEKTGIKATEILPTLRGSIIDRNSKILAEDAPQFYLAIGYDLARVRDSRFWQANALIRYDTTDTPSIEAASKYWEDFLADKIQRIDKIVSNAYRFSDAAVGSIETEIDEINNRMWRMRRYFAWKRNFPKSTDIADFDSLEDEKKLMLEGYVNDLAEMKNEWYMLAKIEEEKLFEAQQFFKDIPGVRIIPQATRNYPYNSAAAQLIGWVNPQKRDNEIFASDELMKYSNDELAGYKGIEYVCEPLLRGKRGRIEYESRNAPPIEQAREFGNDIRLSLDIELQKTIENTLLDPLINENHKANMAAVVINVATGEILSLVSLPTFDLNNARTSFGDLIGDKRRPLENKALQTILPPGSTIKPVILAAGLQQANITPEATISCSLPAEEGWPRCWLQRRYGCHDDQFAYEGGNNAVNALRGSCNIYFTKLAHRIEGRSLQKWLYDFGFGRKILQTPDFSLATGDMGAEPFEDRNIREEQGIISSGLSQNKIKSFADIPLISDGEKRWFGMGQGNLRVTALQVANAFATIARDGVFISPRLYLNCGIDDKPQDIGLSRQTLTTVQKGLRSVINKTHGSAYDVFKNSGFDDKGITIYGKTGSSERPDNAWFAGYATDTKGNCIALAIVVEGGQSGTRDAAPLAREIFNICNMNSYIEGKD